MKIPLPRPRSLDIIGAMTTLTPKVLLAVLVTLSLIGCAKTGDKTFRARAAQDLGCPEGQLRVEHKWENDEAAKKAVGCGREAYYVRECAHEGCLWKLRQQGAPGSTPEVAPPK